MLALLPMLCDGGGFWATFLQLPPAHPILVNVTAGLIPAAVAFDVAGHATGRASLASAGFWMTMLAAVVTPFTVLSGWLWQDDMGGGGAGGEAMLVHKWLGTVFAGLFLGLAAWRWAGRGKTAGAAPAYLGAAVVLVGALAFQGHLGGMMSFGEAEQHEHHETAQAAPLPPAAANDGWGRSIPVP